MFIWHYLLKHDVWLPFSQKSHFNTIGKKTAYLCVGHIEKDGLSVLLVTGNKQPHTTCVQRCLWKTRRDQQTIHFVNK